jgi:hypothetical protein
VWWLWIGKTKHTMDLLLEKHQPFDKIIWIAPEYSLKQVKMKNFIEMIGKHISVFSQILTKTNQKLKN